MTGPEHYREAERLLGVANDRHADADPEGAAIFTQQALVHAMLAQAGAAALGAPAMTLEDAEAWERVSGVPRRPRR